ncbi:MAG TPA: response regulator transcription factor [Pyrinomonadaceae bacterium]|nr:response regulator transcription factor [Pyrinomonadaceae bacterium]
MGLKLLIVDDKAQVRDLIRRFLGDLASEISETDDGESALEAYAAFLPDWVLMDIAMTHTNGIVATQRIMAAYPQARIVIVTNYDEDVLRERATAAGACGYFLKENLLALRSMLVADAMSSQMQS